MSFFQRVISAAVVALFSLGAQATTTLTFDDLAQPDLYQFSGAPLSETTHNSATGLERFTFNNKLDVLGVSWADSALGSSQLDNVTMGNLAKGNVTTPIPEPQTYALMLAGIGVLSMVALRRRRSD